MQTVIQDVTYALRLLRRAPGFTAVALLTMALGIGANAAMFTVVNGVLLRPLPYVDPDRLVRVYQANPEQGVPDGFISVPGFEDWRTQTRSFAAMAAYQRIPMILTGRGDPVELQTAFVIGDFFGTLGTSAQVGRTLLEEDISQAVPNAVISDRLWRTRFGQGDAIGRSILLTGQPYTIIGVMPANFVYPTPDADVWAPHSVLSDQMIGPRVRNQRVLEGIARLAGNVRLDEARAELNSVAARLAAEYPATNGAWSAATVLPLKTTIVGDVDAVLVVVLAVVGFILLIACANLANLLLARATARSREIAVRAALGAGRMRIARQLLTESLLLSLIGGGLGIALAVWGVNAVLALSADTLPRVEDVHVDARVIAFGLLLTLVTGILFGILPALRAARAEPQHNLRGGRGAIGHMQRPRNALVVAEVGLAMVLVICAGLMGRSFLELRRADPGFDPEQVLAVTLQWNIAGIASSDVARHVVGRREELIERVAALPGVVDAGTIVSLPLQGQCRDYLEFTRADGSGAEGGGPLQVDNCLVSTGYLRTMKVPLLRGAPLPDRRTPGTPVPFLVNETAARRFWPGQDPVGQIVRGNYGAPTTREAVVVGVVGDVHQLGLTEEPPPVAYFHHRTSARSVTTVVARTAGDPLVLTEPIRQIVRELDPNQPIRSIAALSEVMSESIARDRFFTILFGVFGALALVLAGVGVYGVLAYSVSQRTQEMGVRMALGARAADVLRIVIGGAMWPVSAGVILGALASLLFTRVLTSQLYGVSATDSVAFVTAPAVLMAVALLACYIPARRATRIDPITALRDE